MFDDDERRNREQRAAEDDGGGQDRAEDGRREDRAHLQDLRRERQRRVAKVVVGLAIAVLLMIFIIANAHPVSVSFVFVTRKPLLIWVMLACTVLGGVVGYLIGRPGRQVRLHRPPEPHGPRPSRRPTSTAT